MNPRHWLTFATLAALQLSVLASTPHTHRHPNHKHIRIVIKGVADDATPPASDATDVGVSVTYTGANTAPADASSGETAAPYVTVLDNPVTAPPAPVPNVVEDPAAGPVTAPPAPLSSAEDPTTAPPATVPGLADPTSYPVTAPPAPAPGAVADPATAPPPPVTGVEDPVTAPPLATAPVPDVAAPTSAPVDMAPPVAVIATALPSSNALPVFFFHGVTSNSKAGFNFNANLTQEGRVFVALDFCQDVCSVSSLNTQVPMAIQQIRSTVANDSRFDHGYIFIGHSQGASIARAVVEEMDDHKVRMLISLAGPQNGIFYGPQPSDAIPTQAFAGRLGPRTIPASIFNFTDYTPADYASGKFQSDMNDLVFNYPALQDKISVLNLARSPVKREWRKANTFLPVVNNINLCDGNDTASCEAAKKQRRANFLKLTSAHFFGSPADDLIAPWQTSLLGQYTDVAKEEDLVPNFSLLEPIGMKFTEEYQSDTYGLKSLDKRDGLFLYEVADVGHSCWVADSVPLGKTDKCLWKPIYEDYIYPLLHTPGWGLV